MTAPVEGEARWQHPTAECDLVMKGGITSGIVYPPAVLALADRYRFRSIGGTSAGAIAAALTAAAESAREEGGFQRLEAVNAELSSPEFLQSLLQPSAELRPVMEALLAASRARKGLLDRLAKQTTVLGKARMALRAVAEQLRGVHPVSAARGAATGAAYAGRAGLWAGGGVFILSSVAALVPWAVLGLPGGPTGLLASLGTAAVLGGAAYWLTGRAAGPWLKDGATVLSTGGELIGLLRTELPRNYWGLSRGLRDPGAPEPAFAEWLTARINELAGRVPDGPPLTFHDLQSKRDPGGAETPIQVAMVTSNLSLGEPYPLPFQTGKFLFKISEMRRYFPPCVVDHLIEKADPSERVDLLDDDYRFLPPGPDLPLVFATRLSLSFPLLISAVPLYTIGGTAFKRPRVEGKLQVAADDLQLNLFSDGGISSNFPIHFFDAWLPSRPTFGINLTTWPEDAMDQEQLKVEQVSMDQPEAAEADDRAGVFLPPANRPSGAPWQPIRSLPEFLANIFNTSQNYRDSMQSRLPSYRERIVQVRLKSNEGGLNLDMPEERIASIKERGRRAGELLLDDFRFEEHRWVRLLVMMSELERNLSHLAAAGIDLRAILEAQQHSGENGRRYPYAQADERWCEKAGEILASLERVLAEWKDLEHFEPKCPRPKPVLRCVPRL